MRKRAIFPIVIYLQEPNQQIHITYCRLRKEVIVSFKFTGIVHYEFRNIAAVGRPCQILRTYGIESMRAFRIVEVHDIHLRLDSIAMVVVKEFIIRDGCKFRKFVVVNEHRITFLRHLLEKRTIYAVALS